MTALEQATDALATYRLARLATTDSFPPAAAARDELERRLPPEWAAVVHCTWCASFWTGAAVAALRAAAPRLWAPLAVALAASTVAGVIHELVTPAEPEVAYAVAGQ